MPFRRRLISGVCAAMLSAAAALPISAQSALEDPVSRLQKRLERGETTLEFRSPGGYLSSVLKELGISVDSQMLVFSKTSLQQDRITPQNPRAIFFNDSVSVGSVPGGRLLEFASLDPSGGIVFHTLDAHESAQPRFTRKVEECTLCHNSVSKFSPGIMVATVYPSADGTPAYLGGPSLFHTTDHRSPFQERWGGWYVTGTHGSQHHLGNAVAPDPFRPADLEQAGTQNRRTLDDKFDVSKYLANTSDIVALMTLEHQAEMTNRITSIAARARLNGTRDPGLPVAIKELVNYMLFVDEAPLSEPVQGVSTFTKTFQDQGPRDSRGRSLRDFDLQRRLFRYPVSYMIYSPSFDAIPGPVREAILRQLFDELTCEKTGARRAAFEILLETKPNLPQYWKDASLSLAR